MVIDRISGKIQDESTFWNLGDYLGEDRVIFFNNSQVLQARIRLKNQKYIRPDGSDGIIHDGEILFCKKISPTRFEALVRPGNKFRIENKIVFPEWYIEVIAQTESGRIFEAHGVDIDTLMDQYWALPLPPYITYSKEKEKDYQTTFALKKGSIAAPTASLHFTSELLERLPNKKYYLTLHVGLGTFKGIDTDDIREYNIHEEVIEIDIRLFEDIAYLKSEQKKIVAVGTTVCRSIESLPYVWQEMDINDRNKFSPEINIYWDTLTKEKEQKNFIHNLVIDYELGIMNFSTSIYIYPGESFLLVDDLITNFHLPQSSLLVLVSAFIWSEEAREIYRYAIEKKYRFFSFWDGMYIRWEK